MVRMAIQYTQPPLVDDIIKYLETHSDCRGKVMELLSTYPEHNMSPKEHYLFVTPNEYTNATFHPI